MPQINWNLDKKIWDKINPLLHESNWKEVNFKYDSRNFISEDRGIYMVTISSSQFSQKIPFKNLVTPIYVGHAINLRTRFMQHTRGRSENLIKNLKYFSQKGMFYFITLPDVYKSQLMYLEQTLIDVFGGSLNKSNPVSNDRKNIIEATIMEGKKHGE
jgi:hypothetical protein